MLILLSSAYLSSFLNGLEPDLNISVDPVFNQAEMHYTSQPNSLSNCHIWAVVTGWNLTGGSECIHWTRSMNG